MDRISAVAVISCIFLTARCGLVLGLDDVRNCRGAECDASVDVATTDVVSVPDAAPDGAWTPAAFGNDLALWLATDYGVTAQNGSVGAWKDRAHGGVAIGSANQPHLDKTIAGNQDAIHFTLPDSVLHLPDSPFLQIALTDAFLVEVVARVNVLDDTSTHLWAKANPNGGTWGAGARLFAGLPGSAGELAAHFDDGVIGYDHASSFFPFNDGAFHIVGIRRSLGDGFSTTRFNLDTTEAPSGAQNTNVDISASGVEALIGHAHPVGEDAGPCDYWIAEIIIVKRPTEIMPIDMAHVWTYLKAKYGI